MATNKLPSKEDLMTRLAAIHAPTSPTDVGEQIRLLISVCRLNESRSLKPRPPKPLNTQSARIDLLLSQAAAFNARGIRYLLDEINTLSSEEARLEALVKIAPHLPPSQREDILLTIWQGIRGIGSAATRARLLFQLFPLIDALQSNPPAAFMGLYEAAHQLENPAARVRSLVVLAGYTAQAFSTRIQETILATLPHLPSDTDRANTIIALSEHLSPDLIERTIATALTITTPDERIRALIGLVQSLPPILAQRIGSNVLDAIEQITAEEQRAHALINAAPHLEYTQGTGEFPLVLERALSVAVGLTRHDLRASALVAIAPHLPLELKGEALAVVNRLEDERHRADLLAALAPVLSENMIIASLAVAHNMQLPDARTHALIELARHTPTAKRRQTLQDALDTLKTLSRPFERVTALAQLLPILPDDLCQQAYSYALEITQQINNENTRSRALIMLSPKLPTALIPPALEIANSLEDAENQLTALAALVEHLPTEEQAATFERMLQMVEEIRYEYRQARALLTIATQVPAQFIPRAVEVARQIEEPYDRFTALIALAQNSPNDIRPSLIGEAWRLLLTIDNGYDRASALATIAPMLPPEAANDVATTINTTIRAITDTYDRASAIVLLAPLLAPRPIISAENGIPGKIIVLRDGLRMALRVTGQQDRADLIAQGIMCWVAGFPPNDTTSHNALWSDIMPLIGTLPFADATRCLTAFIPLIRHLTGNEGVAEMLRMFGLPNDGINR